MVEIEREEKVWLGIIALVAIVFNVVTVSPLVPWQRWEMWEKPEPAQVVRIEMRDHEFFLVTEGGLVPLEEAKPIVLRAGEPIKFVVTSVDLTYGFGVFEPEGRMLFQLQVIPTYENEILWVFDSPGTYTVRSTEYSGPEHPHMFVEGAIQVVGG